MAKGDTKKQPGVAKPKRTPVDWDRIEPGWRAGVKSVLQLAADYQEATGNSVSHTAINKHFKEKGIARDLADKVQAKAQALVSAAAVSAAAVSAEVSTETRAATKPSDAAIIEANADLVATVMLSQRKDIKRNRALVMRLLDELEGVTDHGDTLEQMADMLLGDLDPEDKAAQARREKMLEAINKAISLASRVDSMKKLADTLKTLVALEREAYGITGDKEGGKSYEDVLDDL